MAGLAPLVGEDEAADLDVVLGRDGDLHVGLELAVGPVVLGLVRRERRAEGVGPCGPGVVGRREDLAGIDVAYVEERAPHVARDVLAVARDREALASRVATATVRDHDRVAAVGQEVRCRNGRVGEGIGARHRRRELACRAHLLDLIDVRRDELDGSRYPFLEQ